MVSDLFSNISGMRILERHAYLEVSRHVTASNARSHHLLAFKGASLQCFVTTLTGLLSFEANYGGMINILAYSV